MKSFTPDRFVGKSFAWTFFAMLVLLTWPHYWATSVGLPMPMSHGLYRAAAFFPFLLHLVTGCNFDRMWIAIETRENNPAKYGLLMAATFLLGLIVAFGTNPDSMK